MWATHPGRLLLLLASLCCGAPSPEQQQAAGRCACDVTAGQCDVHCCCDPDCGQEGLAELVKGFDCLPDKLDEATGRHCYSTSWLHSVNPRTDLAVLEDDLRGLLCVVVDNNPVKGVFYTNEAQVPASRINALLDGQHVSSFATAGEGQAATSPQGRGYRAGDILMIHLALSRTSGAIEPITGPDSLRRPTVLEAVVPLSLRVPDLFGDCSADPGQPARFLTDVNEASCWLQPVDLADACTKQLNPRTQVAWMLRETQMSGQSRCSSGRCLLPNTTSSCPLRVTGVDGSTRQDQCAGGQPPRFQDPVLQRTGRTCLCRNALREVHYTFRYAPVQVAGGSSQVAITGVDVRLTLQDVESHGCEPTRVYQATSVRFVQAGASDAHARSGNPGYRVGAPLLVAQCQADGYDAETSRCVAFEEASARTRVATVQGIMPDGACAREGGPSGQPQEVRFGEDSIFGCTLELTRRQLEALCTPPAAGAEQTGFVDMLPILRFGRLGARWSHIAAFGDAPPGAREPERWVEVTAVEASEALEFSDRDVDNSNLASDSSCRGAVVGVDLEIVYSPFGKVGNPQSRVVAARASHRLGSLRHRRLNPEQSQSFPFTFTVTFIRLDDTGQREVEVPPRPRLPLALPHDLFYPFNLGSGAVRQAIPSLAAAALSAVGAHALAR